MGNSSSSGRSQPSSRQVLREKLENASKTGVLNLSDQNLKPSSSIYLHIWDLATILRSLDLSGNVMKVLPSEFVLFSTLKNLNLSRCYLQRGRDLRSLSMLKVIKLDQNDFEATTLPLFPESLIKADISSNHLITFPSESFQGLLKLVELKLCKNRLLTLEGISVLVNLEVLLLDDNRLTFLSEELGLLSNLYQLSVKRNCIGKTYNPEDTIDSSTSKTNSNGGEKQAEKSGDEQSVAPEVFTDTRLVTLNLSGNYVTTDELLEFDGVEDFIVRRKRLKDKLLTGGAMTDYSLFGMDSVDVEIED